MPRLSTRELCRDRASSESESRIELNLARQVRRRDDLAEVRRIDVDSRSGEADRIRNIEHIRREGQLQPFPNADFAPQAERLVQKMRHEEAKGSRARQIPERVGRRVGERGPVDVRNRARGQGVTAAIASIDAHVPVKRGVVAGDTRGGNARRIATGTDNGEWGTRREGNQTGNLPTADQTSHHRVAAAQAVTLAEGQAVNERAVENMPAIDGAQGFVEPPVERISIAADRP